jgi:hypothetical protein
VSRKVRPILDRVFDKVRETSDGCWEWTGPKVNGYGVIGAGMRGGKTLRVHRVTYTYFVDEVPAGLDLDHLCRNRSCCNPWHLEPVTRSVNLLRGVRKTRQETCRNGHPFDRVTARQRVCTTCSRQSHSRKESAA